MGTGVDEHGCLIARGTGLQGSEVHPADLDGAVERVVIAGPATTVFGWLDGVITTVTVANLGIEVMGTAVEASCGTVDPVTATGGCPDVVSGQVGLAGSRLLGADQGRGGAGWRLG